VDGEVVVTIDGIPRPAVVVATDGDRSRVRFRDAGSQREEWVATSSLVPVEVSRSRPPLLKLLGLGVVGVLGPTRMAYSQAIGTVRFVSTLMNELVQHIYA